MPAVILHEEEMAFARAYSGRHAIDGFSEPQLKEIADRARTIHRWHKAHPLLHSAISIAVLVFLFYADYWVLLRLPR